MITPKYVSDSLMNDQLEAFKNIVTKENFELRLAAYLEQDNIHPGVLGSAIKILYTLYGDESNSIIIASRLCNLTPVPSALEYGSSWWNNVGLFLVYPLFIVDTCEDANTKSMKKVIFCAYTALCIGSSLANGQNYTTLNTRAALVYDYQDFFMEFIKNNINHNFSVNELFRMIFCDYYIVYLSCQDDIPLQPKTAKGFVQLDNLLKVSEECLGRLSKLNEWFKNNEPDATPNHMELFKEGDKLHMKYDPEFVQAYNDQSFIVNSEEYIRLFNIS